MATLSEKRALSRPFCCCDLSVMVERQGLCEEVVGSGGCEKEFEPYNRDERQSCYPVPRATFAGPFGEAESSSRPWDLKVHAMFTSPPLIVRSV